MIKKVFLGHFCVLFTALCMHLGPLGGYANFGIASASDVWSYRVLGGGQNYYNENYDRISLVPGRTISVRLDGNGRYNEGWMRHLAKFPFFHVSSATSQNSTRLAIARKNLGQVQVICSEKRSALPNKVLLLPSSSGGATQDWTLGIPCNFSEEDAVEALADLERFFVDAPPLAELRVEVRSERVSAWTFQGTSSSEDEEVGVLTQNTLPWHEDTASFEQIQMVLRRVTPNCQGLGSIHRPLDPQSLRCTEEIDIVARFCATELHIPLAEQVFDDRYQVKAASLRLCSRVLPSFRASLNYPLTPMWASAE